jgi:glycerol-3-phosphate dehydrogenase
MAERSTASLNVARRERELDDIASGSILDVIVIGGGITGAGVALDAASRGLSVALFEKEDLAFGTSRWSSKLVHGGLRYLAHGDFAVAHESAVERSRLIQHIAPHLVRPMPTWFPLLPAMDRRSESLIRAGFMAGDTLRRAAKTPAHFLPNSRRISADEVRTFSAGVKRDGLRGGLLQWDGNLFDDARLVIAVARTAAAHGARILTRCDVREATGTGVTVRDTVSGVEFEVKARAVINATGVWAGQLNPDIQIRPSRGSHIIVNQSALGGLTGSLTVGVEGSTSRFVFAIEAPHGRAHIGLTDVETDSVVDVPHATESEIDFLLSTINTALETPLARADVRGTFAGLRPLVDHGETNSADVSRRHLVTTDASGLVTVTGGKLTTYRAMAEEAVDAALIAGRFLPRPCRTATLGLVGSGTSRAAWVPSWIRAAHGSEAEDVVAQAGANPELLERIGPGLDLSAAQFLFGVRHEGAMSIDDLVDRRTRLGMCADDRETAVGVAEWALAAVHGEA